MAREGAGALAEPQDVVDRCNGHVASHPERVRDAVARWVAKAAAFGVKAPAFVPLRPFVLAESLLQDIASDLVSLIAALKRDAVQTDLIGIDRARAEATGLLDDLASPHFTSWARPDGFFDGASFQVTELNIGNGAAVTAIETAWLTELYEDMGLFSACPELVPRDPVPAWRGSLDRHTNGASVRALGAIVRTATLGSPEWRMFEGQLTAFIERFLAGSELGGVLDPADEAGISAIDSRDGAFFQFSTESMVTILEGYRALRDPARRARWWLPPTVSLLDKNVLPLVSRVTSTRRAAVLPTVWVDEHLDDVVGRRAELVFKSATNDKRILLGAGTTEQQLRDRLTIWGLNSRLIAQQRAKITCVRIPVCELSPDGQLGTTRDLDVWVEASPFLVDGQLTGVFCRCVPASEEQPIMSPPPPSLGLGVLVGVRGS